MNTIIMIDDNHLDGWESVFRALLSEVFGNTITFDCVQFNSKSKEDLESEIETLLLKKEILFILDNELGLSFTGLDLLKKYNPNVIMHSADDIGFEAAKAGALFFMKKDDPANPMEVKKFKKMIVNFVKTIIQFFHLDSELIWILYSRMGI